MRWFRLLGVVILCALGECVDFCQAEIQQKDPSNARGFAELVSGITKSPHPKDGDVTEATFLRPTSLALSPDSKLLYVIDSANGAIRSIDLRTKVTKTLFRSIDSAFILAPSNRTLLAFQRDSTSGVQQYDLSSNTQALKNIPLVTEGGEDARIGEIRDISLSSDKKGIALIQPGVGIRIGAIAADRIVLRDSIIRLPNQEIPAALSYRDANSLVVGAESGQVFEIRLSATNQPQEQPAVTAMGRVTGIKKIVSSKNRTYFLRQGINCISQLDADGLIKPFPVVTIWGDVLPCSTDNNIDKGVFPEIGRGVTNIDDSSPLGVALSDSAPSRIYISNPSLAHIVMIRDHQQFKHLRPLDHDQDHLVDYEIPELKDEGLKRLLLVGDSRLFHPGPELRSNVVFQKPDILGKRLERFLNIQAVAKNLTSRYEVLTTADVSWAPVYSWAYYRVPRLVKKYDVDAVYFMIMDLPGLHTLFNAPYPDSNSATDAESVADAEYGLKPDQEKFAFEPLGQLSRMALSEGLATLLPNQKIVFQPIAAICRNEKTRVALSNFISSTLANIAKKIREVQPNLPVYLVLTPTDLSASVECYESIFAAAAQESNLKVLDYTRALLALRVTLLGSMGLGSDSHLSRDGFQYYADFMGSMISESGDLP